MSDFSLDRGPVPGGKLPPTKMTEKPVAYLELHKGQYGAVNGTPIDPFIIEHSVDVTDPHTRVWTERVHLSFARQPYPKLVAFVELNIHRQTYHNSKVFFRVEVDAEQPVEYKVQQAVNGAAKVGRYYSWLQWVNYRLRRIHPGLFGDPDFVKYCTALCATHKTHESAAGMREFERIMKLGEFEPPMPP